MWAVIGGSGFEQFDEVASLEELPRETPFGLASSGFRRIKVGNSECLFLSRHGKDHELLPSEINYRANIFAIKREGATKVISFSSVGNLQSEIKPKDLILPYQYLNQTRRNHEITTFAGNGVIGHIALGQPIWEKGAHYVATTLASKLSIPIHTHRTYVCIEGPFFSTRAESKLFQSFGGDVVGMTGFPEYALAREAGLSYLPCCFSTDNDSWDDSECHVTLQQIVTVMKENNQNAFILVKLLLNSSLEADPTIRLGNLKENLFCSYERLSKEQKQWLEVIGR